MAECTISAKLVLLGDSAVGKSSIVLRFVKSQFNEFQEATIGAAFLTQTVICDNNQKAVRFEIWDTAGQERYHSLTPMYYRGAPAAIIVYDICSRPSFEQAKAWVDEINAKGHTKVIAFAGNKCDRAEHRAVDKEEAMTYATEKGLIFMETSAKTAVNITELFTAIALRLPRDSAPNPVVGQQLVGPDAASSTAGKCCS